MKKEEVRTAGRFLLVGIVNTVIGSGIMFLLYNFFHCSYWLSSACNYLIGGTVSYFLNKYFTFRKRERSGMEVVKFIVTVLVSYFLAYGLARPFAFAVLKGIPENVRENVALGIGMILYLVFNFLGQRYFAFREKN